MPQKWNEASHGEKLIQLFSILSFCRDRLSLTELARRLQCSKQTVLRLMDTASRRFPIREERGEGNRLFYSVERPGLKYAGQPLDFEELAVLEMCRAFTENLLGKDQFQKAIDGLHKASILMREGERVPADEHFGCYRPGSIDYTAHREQLLNLVTAMEKCRICRIWYRRVGAEGEKIFDVMPLKIFSRHETVYLHARLYLEGKKPRKGTFDPLLAVHRIRKVKVRDRKFEFPADYDFDEAYNRTFGIIKGETFRVRAVFSGWAADFARERIWSPDQVVTDLPGGEVEIAFTASSEWEVTAWVLSYRGAARILEPERLVHQVAEEAAAIAQQHASIVTPS